MNQTRRKLLAFITYFPLFCAIAIIPITVASSVIDTRTMTPTYQILTNLFGFCGFVCFIAHTLLALVYIRLIQNSKMSKKCQLKWTIWLLIAPILVAPVLYAKHRGELELNPLTS